MTDAANPAPGFARNPDKVIAVEPHAGPVTVKSGDVVIARTEHAQVLSEPPLPPVVYIPLADIDFSALEKTDTVTRCPYKGDASYWSVTGGPADALWVYETPYDEMRAIAGHGAFDARKVTVEEG